MKTNPWKGLSSYSEEDIKTYQFCGRTKAIGKFYSYITRNLISTLYGKTGCGKTSLLQAGIFPLLRQESYLPVTCRLSQKSEGETYADYLMKVINREFEKYGIIVHGSTNPVEQVGNEEQYILWKYFYGHSFANETGNIVFPIIVLDQFEETLLSDKDGTMRFLEQINYLVGDSLSLPEDAFANFRIAIALREDFLFLLEDAIDEGHFILLRENRMRLSPLSEEEAKEVTQLGNEMYVDSEKESINKTLINMAKGKRGHISTNMLSLLCSQVYDLCQKKSHQYRVSLSDLEALKEDPLRQFYSELKISSKSRDFIEQRLVNNGFRCPVTVNEFHDNVSSADYKTITEGNSKILQVVTAGDNECVELIHDTLAWTIYNIARNKANKNSMIKFIGVGIESIICIVVACLFALKHLLSTPIISLLVPILVLCNLLYSYSSYGKRNYSRYHLLLLLILNYFIFVWMVGNDIIIGDGFVDLFLCCYLLLCPIVNLLRKKDGIQRVSFGESYGYVFKLMVLSEEVISVRYCFYPTLLLSSVCLCFLSGFFMVSWGLWLILPACVAFAHCILSRFFVDSTEKSISRFIKDSTIPFTLTIIFVIVQHVVWNRFILTMCIMVAFALWSLFQTKSKGSGNVKQIALHTTLDFVLCGVILPILSFGYNPFSQDNIARDFIQPKFIGAVPMYAFHDAEGMHGVADRYGIIMKPHYAAIDSVRNTYHYNKGFMDKISSMYWSYDVIKSYIKSDESESTSDICLYANNGTEYKWSERYEERGRSVYLDYRVQNILDSNYDAWSENEFDCIQELAVAYRTLGGDSLKLAENLERAYFARRFLQAEVSQALALDDWDASDENIRDIIAIILSPIKSEGYKDKFVKVSKSSDLLQTRVKTMCKAFGGENPSMYDIAKIDVDKVEQIIDSYKKDTISYDWFNEALSKSDNMLYYTRQGIGLSIDTIFANLYGDCHKDNYGYWVSRAWHNIYLTKFVEAEKYARLSVEKMPHKELKENLAYTNLVTSLYLSGEEEAAYELLDSTKLLAFYQDKDNTLPLLPFIAENVVGTVNKGICQDINKFIKLGIINDTTTNHFRRLRDHLGIEFSVLAAQVVFKYKDGWNLTYTEEGSEFQMYSYDGCCLPVMTSIDVNLQDSVAIYTTKNGKYGYLDLKTMKLIGSSYDYAWHFSERLAAVLNDGYIGVIDINGNTIMKYNHKTEGWLQNNHYKIAFHNGEIALPDSLLYYRFYDKDNNDTRNGYCFDYLTLKEAGFIVKPNKYGNWKGCNIDGIIKASFDDEISDVIVNQIVQDTIYIYNHFNINNIETKVSVPTVDISGLWLCKKTGEYVYYKDNCSDYIRIGNSISKGQYYLDMTIRNYSNTILLYEINSVNAQKYKYEYNKDSGNIELTILPNGQKYTYYKIRD